MFIRKEKIIELSHQKSIVSFLFAFDAIKVNTYFACEAVWQFLYTTKKNMQI